MGKLELIEQLTQVQENIDATINKMIGIQKSKYYSTFDKEEKRGDDMAIQMKCLNFWKRKFNRILLQLRYKD